MVSFANFVIDFSVFRFLFREIESTNLSRRRQSAPPITACIANSEPLCDDAYLKAIQKFNEYRRTQRPGNKSLNDSIKLNESNSSSTNKKTIANERDDDDSKEIKIGKNQQQSNDESLLISDISINEDERKQMLKSNRKLENSAILYGNLSQVKTTENCDANNGGKKNVNCNNIHKKNNSSNNNRLSLPNFMPKSNLSKEISFRHKSKKKIVQNNNIIFEDEIDEFEQIHCQDSLDGTYNITSPPSKFYKQNSNPFENGQAQTPERRQKELNRMFDSAAQGSSGGGKSFITPKKILRKSHSKRNKGKAPQPPKKTGAESESSELTNYNGSFKRYDFQYSSASESKSSPPKKVQNTEVNAEPKSSPEEKKRRRFSPPYQTVINKHGDVVEYALPYVEQEGEIESLNNTLTKELPPLPSNPPPTQLSNDTLSRFEQIINENFVFLKDLVEDSTVTRNFDAISRDDMQNLDAYMEMKNGKNAMVTDLDRSNDTGQLGE